MRFFLHFNLAGTTYQGRWDNWYGPSGRSSNYSYDYQKVLKSPTGLSLKAINVPLPNKAKMNSLRKSVDIQCKRPKHASACQPLQQMCLFNILSDPCELNNVRITFPYFSFSVSIFCIGIFTIWLHLTYRWKSLRSTNPGWDLY